ncbi:amino acid adenylation domain-containing protein [Sphingomonas sp. MMS24-J13]|uniref:amino acid adenylation domain-containing protein n=1 Tax=Sphingomonas sp. MMS24-J13 TaxID=3238686 RepID=UPI00384D0AEC
MPLSPVSADLHPLIGRIERHAEETPEAIALVCEGSETSYAELWRRAFDHAGELQRRGVRRGDRVAIEGERLPQQFVNLLAVLIAGGIYVPLGEKAPPARRATVAADSGAQLLLSADGGITPLGTATSEATDLPPGYLLYTSGSTGVPKGVLVTLDNLQSYVDNVQRHYPLAPGAKAGQIADLGFDASVHETFGAWSAGAALCVVPTRHVLMWPRYFRNLGIETALLVPSQVRLAHQAKLLKSGSLPALRRVYLGAELVTGQVVRLLHEAAPDCRFVNLWGPTEGTVALTHNPIDEIPADHEGVPIGRAWPDHRVELADAEDDVGEMVAAGPQICRGYWNLPEANAERFFERDGARFYRTGDLARRDPSVGYVFVGRRDRQVKIKGHRIELEECERAIRRLAGTGHAFVVVHNGELVCFVADGIALDTLEAALRADLPTYMIPQRFIAVASFPMTQSAKVDLNSLRATLLEA